MAGIVVVNNYYYPYLMASIRDTIVYNMYNFVSYGIVQSFYEEKGVNLKQIATQMIPTVSSTEKCAL